MPAAFVAAALAAVFGLLAAEAILWPLRRRNAKLALQVAARRRRIRALERELELLDMFESGLDVGRDKGQHCRDGAASWYSHANGVADDGSPWPEKRR